MDPIAWLTTEEGLARALLVLLAAVVGARLTARALAVVAGAPLVLGALALCVGAGGALAAQDPWRALEWARALARRFL